MTIPTNIRVRSREKILPKVKNHLGATIQFVFVYVCTNEMRRCEKVRRGEWEERRRISGMLDGCWRRRS
jgi:hypothetical protein